MAYTYEYPRLAVTADCVVITNETKPIENDLFTMAAET